MASDARGDPVGSDVDVTLTVETVVHLGQALTLRDWKILIVVLLLLLTVPTLFSLNVEQL